MKPIPFTVPEQKRVRMIIDTDCKNESDDQYAVVHHLLTPMLDVRGIVAAHFESQWKRYGELYKTVHASYDEILHLLSLLELPKEPPVLLGADRPMPDEHTPVLSDGARLIIEEALKEDDRPLFVGLLGTATDLASAIVAQPAIVPRLTAIWIGGAAYPDGGWEFNLSQDRHAANVLFSSGVNLWQVPSDTYKQMNVTLSELRWRVATQGKVGEYLFRQMIELNDQLADNPTFPHGEGWCLGDQPKIGRAHV